MENNQQLHKNNRKNTGGKYELEKNQVKETQKIDLGSKNKNFPSFRQKQFTEL